MSSHLTPVYVSLEALPSKASLRMTGYLPAFVGSTIPGAAIADMGSVARCWTSVDRGSVWRVVVGKDRGLSGQGTESWQGSFTEGSGVPGSGLYVI
jgi:hypothetical protein